MSERFAIALDVSGTLWNDRRGDRKYPLYGAFIELGQNMGVINGKAPFPLLTNGHIDWSKKPQCVAAYRDVMTTLTPEDLHSVLDVFSDKQKQHPNIRRTGRQIMHALRGLGKSAVTAVISETQASVVNAYTLAIGNHFDVDFTYVTGSSYFLDNMTERFSGDAIRLNKGVALDGFLRSQNTSQLTAAFADNPRADKALFDRAVTPVLITSETTPKENYPGIYVLTENDNSCTVSLNSNAREVPYQDLQNMFTDLMTGNSPLAR